MTMIYSKIGKQLGWKFSVGACEKKINSRKRSHGATRLQATTLQTVA
jgi:hypothetical protein